MIPNLFPIASRLFANFDTVVETPVITGAGDLVDIPDFSPRPPWTEVAVVVPEEIIVGHGTREKVPIGYQRWVFGISIPCTEGWPDKLNVDDTYERSFAILQKRDVLSAHTFKGRIVAINVVGFHDDHWTGVIALHVIHIKRMLDLVI